MRTTKFIQLLSIIFIGLTGLSAGYAQDDSPPVKRLKQLLATDKNFSKQLELTFENLQDLPNGTANPWRGKDMDDLYHFLNEWFYFLPNTKNGLNKILEFSLLYYRNPQGLKFVLEEPGLSWTKYFVEERGKFMDSEASVEVISEWLADKSLNNDDFIWPEEGFKSFNEFFTRNLKPGVRPISGIGDNSVIVSPTDGPVTIINNDLRSDTQIPIKGRMSLNLNQLLGDSEYVDRFIGGTAIAFFLLPESYHHYHAPVSGVVVESDETVGERLFGIPMLYDFVSNPNLGYNEDFSIFERFLHGYLIFETKNFGYIAMVPVGLNTIGSVTFEDKFKNVTGEQRQDVYKGEKVGHFAYGGSLVILLLEKDRFGPLSVKQGQQIGILKK